MSARVDVLGVGFDRVDLAGAAERILRRLDAGEPTFVITANPEFVMLARSDEAVARIAQGAQLVVADGSGVVAASRLLGDGLPRVPGRLLVDAISDDAKAFYLALGMAVSPLDPMTLKVTPVDLRTSHGALR